jgi:pimeloyl-ACP methyl ester carboxylesterase
VHGTKVHYLRTDRTRTSDAPVHLLVPNPANSASNWLDVLAELRPHAHAVAVDLPGTIAGHTVLPNRRAASIETNALFLRDFADALELDRIVVHGWSAGGMVALLFADLAPERVAGLRASDEIPAGPYNQPQAVLGRAVVPGADAETFEKRREGEGRPWEVIHASRNVTAISPVWYSERGMATPR